jgi:N-acyl homoserine lactone hydrolase
MKMHLLPCGRVRMRKSIFLPASERSETIELPVSSALLRHGQGNVLFDTGCHPSVPENPEARWGGLAKLMVPIMQPGEHVLTGLAGLGLAPDDIDVVINSHLHPDHCGCNAFFRKATFMCHAEELAAARAPNSEAAGYLAAEWDGLPMPVDTLDGERDVFGDGRIVLIHLPGHTPGSIGALAQLERSGRYLLAGDTVSLRETLDTGVIPKNTWNADALAKSLDEVRRIEASGVTVVCSHDATQWDTLRKGADAYD